VDWLDEYAEALGVGALSDEERRVLLRLAREVAHRTERPFAPLSTYLAGRFVASRGDGQDAGAVRDALRVATELLPPEA
jgi:Domain of unknown function (DUF6457)